MIKIAFYKGTKDGIAGVYNRGVRWIEDGIYSHCEIIFSNGLSASSSFMDGGVRFKDIQYDPEKWDIFEISWADEKYAYDYFVNRIGRPYNLKGNVHFLIGFVRGDSYGLFCSEACGGAIGLDNAWQFAPNALAHIIKLINEKVNMKKNFAEIGGATGSGDDDTGHGQPPPPPPKP